MEKIGLLINAMIHYYFGDARRINHFLKVYGFAKAIGELEGLDERTQEILEIAALTHDIGIKNSEIKHDSSSGNYQQIEGPPEAQSLLENLDVDPTIVERVCWLIEHHHSYTDIQGIDYQILVEADFLVNVFEDNMSIDAIRKIDNNIFRTRTGKKFLNTMFEVNSMRGVGFP